MKTKAYFHFKCCETTITKPSTCPVQASCQDSTGRLPSQATVTPSSREHHCRVCLSTGPRPKPHRNKPAEQSSTGSPGSKGLGSSPGHTQSLMEFARPRACRGLKVVQQREVRGGKANRWTHKSDGQWDQVGGVPAQTQPRGPALRAAGEGTHAGSRHVARYCSEGQEQG